MTTVPFIVDLFPLFEQGTHPSATARAVINSTRPVPQHFLQTQLPILVPTLLNWLHHVRVMFFKTNIAFLVHGGYLILLFLFAVFGHVQEARHDVRDRANGGVVQTMWCGGKGWCRW